MGLGKKQIESLKEAQALLQDTHDYDQSHRYGGDVTSDDHKNVLKHAIRRLKNVLVPMISDSPSKSAATPAQRDELDAVFGIAKSLSTDPGMHRAGKAMCKHAAMRIKSVIIPGLSGDDLAAKLCGRLSSEPCVAPGILIALKEVVDFRFARLPEQIVQEALDNGELTA